MVYNNQSAQVVDGVPTNWYGIDHGYLTWSLDPAHVTGTFTLTTSGTVYLAAVKINSRLVSNIVIDLTTAGATLTSGQNFAGLYQNNALIATTADQSTPWAGATGVLSMALVTPVMVNEGNVYVAVVSNGTTKPTFAANSGVNAANAGLVSPNLRFASANTGVTTALPATLSAQTANTNALWVALN